MAVSIEDVLMARALADQQAQPDPAVAMGAGAAGGALLGAAAGSVPHQLGRSLNAMTGHRANPLKPGHRMAGGLVGVILGGALGEGMRRMMIQESPAGAMLAKMQATGGNITQQDQMELERILRQTYSQGGL